jgi:phosphoserine/homoserine phosphotransferase
MVNIILIILDKFCCLWFNDKNTCKEGYNMNIVCLDLEGVLVPEIWIAFSEASNIPGLRLTTRDEPDYDKLMKYRLATLNQHNLGITEIQNTIERIDPMPGAKDFLDELRSITQVIILSDTFSQFAKPIMKKLNYPTIFCNELIVDKNDKITDYKLRCEKTKLSTVRALQSCGFETIASGDSFNDIDMIKASKAGFLFRAPESIKANYADIPSCDSYSELLSLIKSVL